MITLYGFGRVFPSVIGETRDLRALWALEETGLPYRVHGLDHMGGEHTSSAFSEISPFNLLPVIDDDGFTIAESGAILLYLAEKSGKLMPSDMQGRIKVIQWCFAALATVERPMLEIQLIDKFQYDTQARRAKMVNEAGRWLDGLERQLTKNNSSMDDGWITGCGFTIADILLVSVLREIRETDLMDPYPRLKNYYEQAQARPAWMHTLNAYADRLDVPVANIQ